jgi:hypothetical protein
MSIALITSNAANQAPAVTLVTALAEVSDLNDAEYRALYERLAAEKGSLRNIETTLHSAVSYGWWGRYAAGERALDRARKNELRAWAGLPELPPTVTEAVTAGAHADAAVYQVGSEIANRVVLVGADVTAVSLRLNGSCVVVAAAHDAPAAALPGMASVQPGTAAPRRVARGTIQPSLACYQRLNARRKLLELTWDEFLAPLEQAASGGEESEDGDATSAHENGPSGSGAACQAAAVVPDARRPGCGSGDCS